MGIFSFLFGKKEEQPKGNPTPPTPSSVEIAPDWQSVGAVPQELAAQEVLALHQSDSPPLFLDVREAEELKTSGYIPGSLHIPMDDVQGRLGELDPKRPVIVYCASGMRSMDVGALLLEKGFEDVSNLNGGLSAWTGPVEMPAEA